MAKMVAEASLLIPALLVLSVPALAEVTLFNGIHEALFRTVNITQGCSTALNTTLRCPSVVQKLSYPGYNLGLNSDALAKFCAQDCQSDISHLADQLGSSCNGDSDTVYLQIGNISFAEFGEFVSHRSEMMCLRESSDGKLCQEAMDSWDIPADKNLTWPEHTSKCWIDEDTGECWVDEDGGYIVDSVYDGVPGWLFPVDDYAANDYFNNRTGVLESSERHSLGHTEALDWDEYPLEIQCNRCFWKTFALSQQSQWGHMRWDAWAEQVWTNMVRNCDIDDKEAAITPFRNLTGLKLPERDGDGIMWELCPGNMTVPEDNDDELPKIAERASLPIQCIRNFNPDVIFYSAHDLRGMKLCAPRTCEVAVVKDTINIQTYMQTVLKDVPMRQFLKWNECLDQHSDLLKGDTVCLGPHKGKYTPTTTGVATTSIFTRTATPNPAAPTPSGTIENCGRFHIIDATDSCTKLSIRYQVTVHELRNMNPTIDSECTNLEVDQSYCVAPVNGTDVPEVTTTYTPTQLPSTTGTPGTTSGSTSATSGQRVVTTTASITSTSSA